MECTYPFLPSFPTQTGRDSSFSVPPLTISTVSGEHSPFGPTVIFRHPQLDHVPDGTVISASGYGTAYTDFVKLNGMWYSQDCARMCSSDKFPPGSRAWLPDYKTQYVKSVTSALDPTWLLVNPSSEHFSRGPEQTIERRLPPLTRFPGSGLSKVSNSRVDSILLPCVVNVVADSRKGRSPPGRMEIRCCQIQRSPDGRQTRKG